VGERRGAESGERGEGHSVDVAAGRSFGRVEVGVGVDPDEADFLLPLAVKGGDTGDGPGGDGVVSAEDDGAHAFFERLLDDFSSAGTGFGDLGEIAGVLLSGVFGFGDGDADVAGVV